MECISEEALDNLSADSRVWVILDKAQPETYLLFPKNDEVRALWAFLKREDAEHLMYLLKTLAPEYKDIKFLPFPLINAASRLTIQMAPFVSTLTTQAFC